jgi:hypothetical protein
VLNRSLVKRFCAEDVTGLKLITEAAELAYAKLELSIELFGVKYFEEAPIGRGAFYSREKEYCKVLWTD